MKTSRFGEIEINEDLIFTFVEPIIGYDEFDKYVLIEHKPNSAFKWLQSIQNPELAFPVTTPDLFNIEYEFEIPDEKAEQIELNSVESLIALNIVTIPNGNPKKSTINLLAPIIINASNKKALQLVLQNTDLEVRHPLFKEEEAE